MTNKILLAILEVMVCGLWVVYHMSQETIAAILERQPNGWEPEAKRYLIQSNHILEETAKEAREEDSGVS